MNYYLKQYKSRVANSGISLDRPISIQTLLGDIKSELSRKHAEPLSDFETLYFWDLGTKASKYVKVGDTLYIITKADIYYGVITIHIVDPPGGHLHHESVGFEIRPRTWMMALDLSPLLERSLVETSGGKKRRADSISDLDLDLPYVGLIGHLDVNSPSQRIGDQGVDLFDGIENRNAVQPHDLGLLLQIP